MRAHGLLPVILVFFMVLAVYFGYAQGQVTVHPRSMLSETPLDGALFLFLSIATVYGGQVLYRKD